MPHSRLRLTAIGLAIGLLASCGAQSPSSDTESPQVKGAQSEQMSRDQIDDKPASSLGQQAQQDMPDYEFLHGPSEMNHEPGNPRKRSYNNKLMPKEELSRADFNTDIAPIFGVMVGDDYATVRAKLKTFFATDGFEGGMRSTTAQKQYYTASSDRMSHPTVRAYDVIVVLDQMQNAEWIGARIKCWDGPNKDVWSKTQCPS